MALCPGLPGTASTRKVKPVWILLKQEAVTSAGTHASLHLVQDNHASTRPLSFYRPDALSAARCGVTKRSITLHRLHSWTLLMF